MYFCIVKYMYLCVYMYMGVCIYVCIYIYTGVSPGFGRGGGQEFFFQIWKFACREARVVRGHAPPRNFFKMVQFGGFWCIF